MLTRALLALSREIRVTPRQLAWLADRVPLWAIRKISEARLLRTLRHVYRNSPAQRERWGRAGVKLSDLGIPEVLRHIPFTTGADIIERPEDYKCAPPGELVHVVSTAGTKGRRKQVFLTQHDLDHHLTMIGMNFRRLGRSTRILVMFCVSFPGWATAHVIQNALERAGVFSILSGAEHSPQEQISLIREHNINVLFTTPTYLHRLTVEADVEPRSLGIRYIHLGAQAWTEAFRAEMASAWGATLIDCYGSAESAFGTAAECVHQNGLHVAETDFWLEVVDPASGTPLPDGEEGELILTTLSRFGMPLVRYRTRDIAHLIKQEGRCACGMPLRKMSRVRGRLDDILKLGVATNVYPDDIDTAVLSVPGVTDYRLVVGKDGYKDTLHVTVEQDGEEPGVKDAVTKALLSIAEIRHGCEHTQTVTIDGIEVVPRGTLSEARPKSNRVVDRRT